MCAPLELLLAPLVCLDTRLLFLPRDELALFSSSIDFALPGSPDGYGLVVESRPMNCKKSNVDWSGENGLTDWGEVTLDVDMIGGECRVGGKCQKSHRIMRI